MKISTRKRTVPSALLAALAIFIFLLILRFFFASALTNGTAMITKPLWQGETMLWGNTQSVEYLEPKSILIAQINTLQMQLYDEQAKNLALQNSATVKNTVPPISSQSLSAQVIAKPPIVPFDMFIVNKGRTDGIHEGDIVSLATVALGTINQVMTATSRAVLFSSSGQVTQAEITRTGSAIELHGDGGGTFEASVPKDFDVNVDDTLTMVHTQEAVASVYYVENNPEGSFKKVLARLPFNVFQTDAVNIETASSTQ